MAPRDVGQRDSGWREQAAAGSNRDDGIVLSGRIAAVRRRIEDWTSEHALRSCAVGTVLTFTTPVPSRVPCQSDEEERPVLLHRPAEHEAVLIAAEQRLGPGSWRTGCAR